MTGNYKRIQDILNAEVASGSIAGVNCAIFKDNKEIYYAESGFADKEKQIPVKRDTIFRLFSMTKPITATAVMMLFERGEISLNYPVSWYLDGFKNQKVWTGTGTEPVKRELTINDLLNMTAGIPYPDSWCESAKQMTSLFDEFYKRADENPMSTSEFCNRMGETPLIFQPGEEWMYGLSADILGAIIEKVSGKTLGQFFESEIFSPLGMNDTGFSVPKEKQERFAQLYCWDDNSNSLLPFTNKHIGIGYFDRIPSFESGGAGLVSTIADYAKFANMLASEGTYNSKRILGRKTVEYLRSAQLNEKQKEFCKSWDSMQGYSYGNLMRVMENKSVGMTNSSIGEYGWDGWTGTYFCVDPIEHSVIIYMIQKCGAGSSDAIKRIRAIAYGSF